MNVLYNKPHAFFWTSIPIIFAIGYPSNNESIDINIHDTYFVISNWHLALLIILGFAIIGCIYWGLFKSNLRPIRWMTLAHLILTIDLFIFIWLTLLFDWFTYPDDFPLFDENRCQYKIIFISLLLIILGQLIFATNVLLTVFFRKKP
ncbi:MAG: hypothetical protein AAF901_14460 [Bacteroidota bacterium]